VTENGSVILTAEQLAERWSVSTDLIYAWCREGKLPMVPLPGRYRRFRSDVIEKFEKGELKT